MQSNGASSRQAGGPATTHEAREAFFTRVVGEHARFLFRVAASVLRHPQDAEDAVQDALLKLYRGESWQGIADERAFLARVVWRTALDRRASRIVPAEDNAEYRLHDTRATPEHAALEGDQRGLLQAWIDELTPELREPLLLSAIEEMNSREIGEVMGLPEGTVRTRLMRARTELRARWERRQDGTGQCSTASLQEHRQDAIPEHRLERRSQTRQGAAVT